MKIRYNQLSIEEREKISVFKAEKRSVREIGRILGRHHGTILREIKRNGTLTHGDYYYPNTAHERSTARKKQAAQRKRLKSETIRWYVESRLQEGWSPEQIAGRIDSDIPGTSISHEAIYQFVYLEEPLLRKCLPRKHRIRYKKGHSRKHKTLHIPNRIDIDRRPISIEKRKRFGHWESDLVESGRGKACLNVLVERKTRFVQITKIKDGTAKSASQSIRQKLAPLPKKARRSITYDNGSENVLHEKTNDDLGTKSYFCHPYHSWEKGTVENTIGLIRRFISKGTELEPIQHRFIRKMEFLLNSRPRKCLAFRTPAESFEKFGGALAR